MKKIAKIISTGIALALTAIILVSYGQPVVTTLASHSFPEKLEDWSEKDWKKFYEYTYGDDWKKYWNASQETSKKGYEGWYNGKYYYWNGEQYYYVAEDGCRYYCDIPPYYQPQPQPQPQPYYGGGYGTIVQPNSNTAYANNYYGGIINTYDQSTEAQAVVLAKIINLYGHGVASQTAQACVGWAVLNSVDASSKGVDICAVAPNFHYDAGRPTKDDFGRDLMPLARDIIYRWKAGKAGVTNNGRVLPAGYCYVWSTGNTVAFRNTPNESGAAWNYSYQSPYGN